jgi:hypothetical protein
MLVMINIKNWLVMFKATIATVEKERLFILEKMDKKRADQVVSRNFLEAKLGHKVIQKAS